MSQILKSLINYLEEPVLIYDEKRDSLHQNNAFLNIFHGFEPQNWQNEIKKLEYKLHFELCLLESEDLKTYTPISALIRSQIEVSTFVSYEKEANNLLYFVLKTAKIGNYKLIYFYDISKRLDVERLEIENQTLLVQNRELAKTAPAAQNQAVKMALLNRISNLLHAPSLNTEAIINIAIKELTLIFRANKVNFISGKEIEEYGDVDGITFSITLKEHNSSKEHFSAPIGRIIMPVLPYGIFAIFAPQKELQESERELLVGISNQILDALELKETQLQLINSEKMASLGQLIASVAHEINTPLASISANNEIMEKLFETPNVPDSAELLADINSIDREAIVRITNLVKSLKRFVRLDETELQQADINAELDLTLELLRHKTKGSIAITKKYSKIPLIDCYPNMLNQVFLNILSNAIDAIKSVQNEGEIGVTTEFITPDTNGVTSNFLAVKISNNGVQINEDVAAKIFQAGFTTKKIGEGTGLGLAICKKIIDKHGGKIYFTSASGRTEFVVEIPYS